MLKEQLDSDGKAGEEMGMNGAAEETFNLRGLDVFQVAMDEVEELVELKRCEDLRALGDGTAESEAGDAE